MSLLVDSLRRIAYCLYAVGTTGVMLAAVTILSQCYVIAAGVVALSLCCIGAAWRLQVIYRGLDLLLGHRYITGRYLGD